jgi:hypothetical protein
MVEGKPVKKAAAAPKKAAESTVKAEAKPDVPVYAFTLPRSHYFSTASTARRSTSSGPHVASIQRALKTRQTGTYDNTLRAQVMQWQADNKRDVTGVIDSGDWDALINEV